MKPHSSAFIVLENEFNNLTARYLPDLNSGPTAENSELARAFVVFFHAEIEFYLETICRDLANSALDSLKAGTLNIPAAGLLTFGSLQTQTAGDELFKTKNAVRAVSNRIGSAAALHKKAIDDNHGIRENHLAKMFIPMGLTCETIDPIWISAINQFSDKRGAYAHKSRQHEEARPLKIDPGAIHKEAFGLLFGAGPVTGAGMASLVEFDQWYKFTRHATESFPDYKSAKKPFLHQCLWALTRMIVKMR